MVENILDAANTLSAFAAVRVRLVVEFFICRRSEMCVQMREFVDGVSLRCVSLASVKLRRRIDSSRTRNTFVNPLDDARMMRLYKCGRSRTWRCAAARGGEKNERKTRG